MVGVFVGFRGASFNRIGGTLPGEGNLISGNDMGVSITGSNAPGNMVLGNLIGTDAAVLNVLGNVQDGVTVSARRNDNRGKYHLGQWSVRCDAGSWFYLQLCTR